MKQFICVLFVLSFSLPAAAQEHAPWRSFPWALGGGAEVNQGSKSGWAQGYSLTVDRVLFDRRFALGLRASMDSDYRTVSTFSAAFSLRLYPFAVGPGGPFLQFAAGAGSWQEDDRSQLSLLVDWSAGFRLFFLRGFFAEAYLRSGFPSQWAFGFLAGHSFTF
jgi:hypothetical protein